MSLEAPGNPKLENRQENQDLEELKAEILTRRYFIFSVCLKYLNGTGRMEAAEELANQALFKAINNAHQYDRNRNLYVWLAVIAKNTVSTYFQTLSRENKNKDKTKAILGHETIDTVTPEELLIKDDLWKKQEAVIKTAIQKLPHGQREVLEMSLSGSTNEEISRIKNITEATVRVHLSKARKNLMEIIGRQTIESLR